MGVGPHFKLHNPKALRPTYFKIPHTTPEGANHCGSLNLMPGLNFEFPAGASSSSEAASLVWARATLAVDPSPGWALPSPPPASPSPSSLGPPSLSLLALQGYHSSSAGAPSPSLSASNGLQECQISGIR